MAVSGVCSFFGPPCIFWKLFQKVLQRLLQHLLWLVLAASQLANSLIQRRSERITVAFQRIYENTDDKLQHEQSRHHASPGPLQQMYDICPPLEPFPPDLTLNLS